MSHSRGEQRAWYFYDWAVSAFSTTVVTLLLGPYLTALARSAADSAGHIYPLGIPVDARSYWSYLLALSVITQVVCLPVLGALADFSPRKKLLLGLFAYIGAGATMAMFFVAPGLHLWGGLLFLIANLSLGASVVIYNSFLPQIAPPEERDAVSSKGWGLGYLGGGLLLALNLVMLARIDGEAWAVRLSLASAGLWWAVFALIPLAGLRNRAPLMRRPAGRGYLAVGIGQLLHTLRDLRHYPQTLLFLAAYLIYNDGIQAVITLSGQFGADELKIPISVLTLAILMVQFVAFLGAMAFNALAARSGAKAAILMGLTVWTAVIVAIYAAVRTTAGFFIAAAVVGLVLGGSQALSRSLYSQMIPKGREAEYFSLYEISDKGTSWLAPLLFGLALQFTRSYRLAMLSLIVFFLVGLALLARVDVRRATSEAGHG